ncbi:transcriptional regulator [Haladaptatus sp. R4]|uniref:ArsR/SmtB family transcription factor n=1 Tax=Haladaptatus sp. R4 TaxID=1679489 RepID=UPI0007B4A680|nr:winged helix-turn-helix domain-containing protein [Haladaptatus sp. R4]KZN26525.1 transcriptional regulator [Haladaptatus sp. R4]
MSLLDMLGSKPRLEILRLLSREPMYVSELAEEVGMDGKTAVHHLRALEGADLIEPYRQGNRKYYRLTKVVTLRAAPYPERTFIVQASDVDGGTA